MLDRKLEEAASKRRTNAVFLVLITVVILLGGTLFFIWTDTLSPASGTKPPVTVTQDKVKPVTIPVAKQPAPPLSDAEARQKFVTLLGEYEREFEPTIISGGFAAWNGSLQRTLTGMKDAAVLDLAGGRIDIALAGIEDLQVMAHQSALEFERTFQSQLSAAKRAYDADQYAQANLAISKALSFKPKDQAALSLRQKIFALPVLLDLIDQAKVAGLENNLAKELDLSRRILDLDPTRERYRTRSIAIEKLLTEIGFEAAVARGLQAFSDDNVEALKIAYSEAKGIFPARAETKTLETKLRALKKRIALNQFKENARSAIKADRWQDARDAFENAAALDPLDNEVAGGLDLSAKILKSQSAVRTFLNQPERLSTNAVAKKAKKSIESADAYSAVSPSLKEASEELQHQITAQNRLIEVVVLSDNLTLVSVKGVGKVGKTLNYRIKLKPGSYSFEGRRKGFKAKIVTIRIKPEDQTVQVRIVSDEPI